jgi:hypothetical protein
MKQLEGVPVLRAVPVTLNDQGTGLVTATIAGSDLVLSVQPDGTLQTRPAGTAGGYELAKVVPQGLAYQPIDEALFVVPIVVV